MGKFNETKKPTPPTYVNDMGEKAYNLEAHEELVATCLTTFLQDSYYEKEAAIVARIIACIKKVNNPLFVAKLAVYCRHTANMRSVSHLLAAEIAPELSGTAFGTAFYKAVYNRPDDMSEILAYLFHKQGNSLKTTRGKYHKIPNAMRRAFAEILAGMDPYTIDKYKLTNRSIKLVDMVNMLHPKPTDKNKEAFRRLMVGESLADLYSSKTFEQAFSATGQKATDSGETVEDLKGNAFREMLSQTKGMPIMSLMKNLRNLLMYAPDMYPQAVAILVDDKRIMHSRLLPFRFATAYTEIEKWIPEVAKGSVVFEKDKATGMVAKIEILRALETGLQLSLRNVPQLPGNTALLIDHSGSVRGDGGGSGKLSAFGATTSAMVGNLMASMYAYVQDNVYIGLFGDRLITVPVNRKIGLLEFNKLSFNAGGACGASTENGLYIFLQDVITNKTKVDNLIIFSDMVIGAGGKGGWDGTSRAGFGSFQELFKKFKTINPKCNTICVDIRQTKGTSVFDRSLGVTNVAGWSTSIFDTFANASKGYDGLIEEIKNIQF